MLWALLLVVGCAGLLLPVKSANGVLGISDNNEQNRREQAVPVPDDLESPSAVDRRTGTYGPGPDRDREAGDTIPPFGAHLFTGGFRGTRASGLNPSYRILPGDQVTLRAWGAAEIDRVLPVDAQGNIFVPNVGPIHVEGVSNSELDSRVRAAIREVFTDNVSVYTNLQGVQPVAVFVTGFVNKPGRYAGNPNDSLLYFLDQAGGIDKNSGSFRRIRVLRERETLEEVDLYDFLLAGDLARPQFEDGDTIVVERRGPVVTVSGDVAQAYRYELDGNARLGHELIQLVQLEAGVSHVLIRGVRDRGPVSAYLPLHEFESDVLRSGDEVIFAADQRTDSIVVHLEGSYYGPSHFAVPKDATLRELLDSIEIDPDLTDARSVSLRRRSVAERQRQSLEDSLRRLESVYLGAPASTPEEATMRAREAELIQDFVARASQIEPTGRMVVAHDGEISNIRLQDGDVITIPERSDSVLVSGEVRIPQAIVYRSNESARDYVERAGGFTERANRREILLVRQNGEVVAARRGVALRPGDEILVLPTAPTKNLHLAATLTQILFQIAVTTAVVLDI
ncbi:capsid assembly protein [Alkalilimnicola ehrlichii]|uniref:Capsid assembly protein n=2 Tax=Alkalilimnicola ehrlichii TaxID=351052 RepID=A0A3E0WRS0_9GAMM|nr:capsid assembly protein [Alkalilimnicola ehrlichii]RFA34676.1 capsid assembly protein [Alkalilimnicola ehrlichii]